MHLPKCGAVPTDLQGQEALDFHVASGARHLTLLTNNEPPEDSEKTFIRSLVSTADARLTHLDEEISKLRAQLKRLEEERASFFSYRARNRAILSPLRRMPPEVLNEIFFWTLPLTTDTLRRTKFDMGASPWVLSRISSRWRAIALSTPSLWSRIVVDFSESQDASSAYPLPFAKAQIERSQKLKIHFYGDSEADSQPQIELFQLLAQHSSRWEEFSIGVTSAIVPLLPAVRHRIPLLKRLYIQWQDAESQSVESLDCFQTAPSLVDAGIYNEFHFLPTAFPVHQLTRYQLDAPWATHREILNLAPNLIEARIEIDFDREPWPKHDEHEIIDLRHLRRLYIYDVRVLPFLRLPVVEELAMWVSGDNVDPSPADLESFVNRSACLRRLCLTGSPNADVTSKMLQETSSITELVILATDSDAAKEVNALLTALTVSNSGGSTMIAPQLRLIVVGTRDDDHHIDEAKYIAMLRSRRKINGCALESAALLIESPPEPCPEMLDRFRTLREEGLNLLTRQGKDAVDEMQRLAYAASWNL
ncbi:hypothetical protein DFH06DRAFT_1087795 [Mycena polygramma]|nr:hypothetical protein DFH06DRAFT_1087795 [Mycena polygramma]